MGSFFGAVARLIVRAVRSKAFRQVVVPIVTDHIKKKIEESKDNG